MTPKKLLIIILAVFAFIVVAACGVRAFLQPAIDRAQEQSSAAHMNLSERQARAGLDDADVARVMGYSSDVAEASALLEANLWIGSGDSSQLRFGPGFFYATDKSGNEIVGKFVIGEVSSETETTNPSSRRGPNGTSTC